MTGGSGRLGAELRQLMPQIIAPTSTELDICSIASVKSALEDYVPDVFIHAAAFTDVSGAESKLSACWQTNVQGTQNIVKALKGSSTRLIYISTDYVFSGFEGNYTETDALGPAQNFYSLSKLVAEGCVIQLDDCVVIRTSFRPRKWVYPNAFSDMYTSQDYVDIIAKEVALAIKHSDLISTLNKKVIHIATERKSVYELALRRASHVNKASKTSVSLKLPKDVSLDCSNWTLLKDKIVDQYSDKR